MKKIQSYDQLYKFLTEINRKSNKLYDYSYKHGNEEISKDKYEILDIISEETLKALSASIESTKRTNLYAFKERITKSRQYNTDDRIAHIKAPSKKDPSLKLEQTRLDKLLKDHPIALSDLLTSVKTEASQQGKVLYALQIHRATESKLWDWLNKLIHKITANWTTSSEKLVKKHFGKAFFEQKSSHKKENKNEEKGNFQPPF